MSEILKHTFYRLLKCSGAFYFARLSHRHTALVLTYHGVLSEGSENYVNRNCVSAEMFERQMRWLKRHYQVISASKLVDALRGKIEMPKNTAVITFDDGFRNNYQIAYPILKKLSLPATIFVTTDFIGTSGKKLWTEQVDSIIYSATIRRLHMDLNGEAASFDILTQEDKIRASDKIRGFLKSKSKTEREQYIKTLQQQIEGVRDFLEEMHERYDFLKWQEIREMVNSGLIEIGSHTCSHSILSTLTSNECEAELLNSKMAIEAQLDSPCTLFSYPNGTIQDFTGRDCKILEKLGFKAAFSQIDGFNEKGADLFAIKRTNIVRSSNFAFFQAKATGIWNQIKNL